MTAKEKTILILGAGIDQTIAIKLAKEMDVRVIALDSNPQAPGLKLADLGMVADIKDVDEVLKIAKKHQIDGVMVHGLDIPWIPAKVAEVLGLPGLKPEVAERATNKLKRLKCFKENQVPCPKFESARNLKEAKEKVKKIGFPCVFKHPNSWGAKKVMLVQGLDEIEKAYREVALFSKPKLLLIEEYLKGHELSTEGVVLGEKVYHTSFDDRNYKDKEKYLPYFLENGGDLPSELPESEINKVKAVIEAAVKVLGINFGAVKGDIIIDKEGPKIIEMACRSSGGFFSSVQTPIHNGIQILKPLIALHLGERFDENELLPKYNKPSIERYIFQKSGKIKSISGIEEAEKMPGILFLKMLGEYEKNSLIPKTQFGITDIGVVIGTGETKEIAIKNVEKAVNKVKIELF